MIHSQSRFLDWRARPVLRVPRICVGIEEFIANDKERVGDEEYYAGDQTPARFSHEDAAQQFFITVVDLHVGERRHDESTHASPNCPEQCNDLRAKMQID